MHERGIDITAIHSFPARRSVFTLQIAFDA